MLFGLSSLKALYSEYNINSKMIANGKAAMIDAVCSAVNPPDHKRTAAAAAWITPQTTLMMFGGFKLPLVVCMASTNVAESAEVIKNVQINKIAKIDVNVPQGK